MAARCSSLLFLLLSVAFLAVVLAVDQIEEDKRARNPYSWLNNVDKRARNPYSWMGSDKRARNPYSWTMFEKRARNPYSWTNFN